MYFASGLLKFFIVNNCVTRVERSSSVTGKSRYRAKPKMNEVLKDINCY